MKTQTKGNITELKIATKLLEKGYVVSIPYGGNARYDLVVEKDNKFLRIQCKTARFKKFSVTFSVSSQHILTGKRFNYKENIDYFGVYCPALDECYLVPVEITGKSECVLRTELPKFKRKKSKLTKDYIL